MDFFKQIKQFTPITKQEKTDQNVILTYIENHQDNILTRYNKLAHITSSSMIFNTNMDKVLMIYHNLYRSWSWTGGHADGNSDLLQVAIKEAIEETGVINITPLQPEIFTLEILPVWGHMKHGEYVNSHLHLNLTYILTANESDKLVVKEDEASDVRWLPINSLEKYISEPAMINIYNKIINRALVK